jgi:hypothetical protein
MSEPQFGPPREVITSIYQMSPEALEQLAQWIETRGIRTPASQISGFQQFLAQSAPSVLTIESTTVTTYGDLATVGPSLTGLSDGNYIVLFGCRANGAAADSARMSISVNGTAASDSDDCQSDSQNLIAGMSVMRAVPKRLNAGGNNTIVAKYRSQVGANVSFGNRWLTAIRWANL